MFTAYLALTLVPNYLHNERDISFGMIGAFGALVAVGNITAGMALTRGTWTSQSLNGALATMIFFPVAFLLMIDGRHAVTVGVAYLFIGVATVSQQAFYGPLGEVTPNHLRTRTFATLEVSNGAGLMLSGFAAGALYSVAPALPLWVAFICFFGVIVATVWLRRMLHVWTSPANAYQPEPA